MNREIIWHMEDLNISQKDQKVVEDIIKQLNAKFGQESLLTTTHGKVLEYLGMTIDKTKGNVKTSI